MMTSHTTPAISFTFDDGGLVGHIHEKHWPKFRQVVAYAAEQVRAGRMRCVTSSDYLGFHKKDMTPS